MPDRTEREESARRLLEITRGLALELRPQRARALRPSLDASLDRDFGLDSLARVELWGRIERAFGVRLPESLLADAQTPADLLAVILAGGVSARALETGRIKPVAHGPAEAAPENAATLLEVLDWHVRTHPDRPHLILGTGAAEEVISYQALSDASRRVAAGLHARGHGPGEAVAIMLPTGRSFFETFLGVLRAGGVPVPIYPPVRPAQLEEHLRRQAGILGNARASVLLTTPEAQRAAGLLRSLVDGLHTIETVDALAALPGAAPAALPKTDAPDTALLQYTSGSTGQPKGVVLSHANLLANIRAMGRALEVSPADVFVSWLPLYHDMGLIGAWLGSLYHAVPAVILSPLQFLARPERWLWAIHRHRATLSAAPNFGYELCVRRIADADLEGLDLSSWRFAANGAEPVSATTIRRFAERFARCGFRPEAMAPVYGLAECAVGLAFPPPGRAPLVDRIARDALARRGQAVPTSAADPSAIEVVGCGRPLPGHEVRIVDGTGREVPERRQGRLQFRGPSATRGYFRNPDKTRELFQGEWLESGDLAYVASGEIYLTGRTKDLIIRAGRNLYAHEIEEAVGDIAGVRKGCVAVFGSAEPGSPAAERIVVLAETRETDPAALGALRRRIDDVTASILDGAPDEVVLAPPHTVLKTSSGKIRRAACRELYEQGRIGRPARAVWWQVLRLAWAGLRPRLREGLRSTGVLLYAAYWWTLLVAMALVIWPLALLLPGERVRWATLRAAARSMLRLWGVPLAVRGLEHLPAGPSVLIVNHSSYLDGVVLVAALPRPCRFVAKKEFERQRIAGPFLRRIGALFVERADPRSGAEDARLVAEALTGPSRHPVVFFPEATFFRMPGLLPFKMGAFVVAAETGVPVVPAALRGTRSILRGDQWLPRRGRVELRVAQPILPRGSDWQAALQLRDAARAEVLAMCGEPDLGDERVAL